MIVNFGVTFLKGISLARYVILKNEHQGDAVIKYVSELEGYLNLFTAQSELLYFAFELIPEMFSYV